MRATSPTPRQRLLAGDDVFEPVVRADRQLDPIEVERFVVDHQDQGPGMGFIVHRRVALIRPDGDTLRPARYQPRPIPSHRIMTTPSSFTMPKASSNRGWRLKQWADVVPMNTLCGAAGGGLPHHDAARDRVLRDTLYQRWNPPLLSHAGSGWAVMGLG